VSAEIERLTAAIASGVDPSVMADAIRTRQAKRTELEAALATAEPPAVTVDVKAIRAKVRARMADWQKRLRGHVAQARQVLRKFMDGPLEIAPPPDGTGVRVRGEAALGRILAGIVDVPTYANSPLLGGTAENADPINVDGEKVAVPMKVASPMGTDDLYTIRLTRWTPWKRAA
jgi:hypothetical protein